VGSDDIGQVTDRRRAVGDPQTTPLRVPCSVHCACLHKHNLQHNRRQQIPFVRVSSPVCTRHAPACACPSCAHARHLTAPVLPMPAHALCLRVFAMLIFLVYYFTDKSIQRSACVPTRTPDSVDDSSGAKPKTLVCLCPASVSMHRVLFYLSVS